MINAFQKDIHRNEPLGAPEWVEKIGNLTQEAKILSTEIDSLYVLLFPA